VTEPDDLRKVTLSVIKHIFNMSRNIVLCHIVHSEVPELLIISSVIQMLIRISSTAIVGSPYVIAKVNQLERDVQGVVIKEPSTAIINQTVLHDDWLSDKIANPLVFLAWDAECSENIAILSDNLMFFIEVSAALNLLLNSPLVGLGIGELR